jgi:gliding motility-associated-like protein
VFFLLVWGCKKYEDPSPVNKPQLFVPTAFTPNGDNVNDSFIVTSKPGLAYFDIKIYENSNILIFENSSIKRGWDGTFNGKPEPAGSYLWVIEYKAVNSDKFTQSGYVELVR